MENADSDFLGPISYSQTHEVTWMLKIKKKLGNFFFNPYLRICFRFLERKGYKGRGGGGREGEEEGGKEGGRREGGRH